jgi:hypothetical protein
MGRPALFIASLQKLLRNEKFKEILIAKARMLGSYRYSDAKEAAQETIEQVVARIRENMRSRYDGTARTLGFTERQRWWVWRTLDNEAPMKIGVATDGAGGPLLGACRETPQLGRQSPGPEAPRCGAAAESGPQPQE